MITEIIVSIAFFMLCALNLWQAWDCMKFKQDLDKRYLDMQEQRDLITVEMLNRLFNESIESENYEQAERIKSLISAFQKNPEHYTVSK